MKVRRLILCVTLVIASLLVTSLLGLFYKWGQLGGEPGRRNQLFVAIWRDDTNVVGQLLTGGINPNAPSLQVTHSTPLIDAVRLGRIGISRLLLQNGADPNRVDAAGYGALYHALDSPYLRGWNDLAADDIIRMLLAHGADLWAKGISNAITELPTNDRRRDTCLEALQKWERTNAPLRAAEAAKAKSGASGSDTNVAPPRK